MLRTVILIILFIDCFTLVSQEWVYAHWVTVLNEKDSGWVQLPVGGWKNPHAIKYKLDEKGKIFRGDYMSYIRTSTGEELLISPIFEGSTHKLQLLLKGEVSLYKEVNEYTTNFIAYYKGEYIRLPKNEVKFIYNRLLNEKCKPITRSLLFYNVEGMLRSTSYLNKELGNEESKWLAGRWAKHRWRFGLNLLSSKHNDFDFFHDLTYDNKTHYQLSIERNFSMSIPALSYILMGSYSKYEIANSNTFINGSWYSQKLNNSYLKIYNGLQYEILGRRMISPFISGGLVVSYPLVFDRVLNAREGTSLNGGPSRIISSAKLSSVKGGFYSLGLRINVTERIRFKFFYQKEAYRVLEPSSVSETTYTFLRLNGINKISPNERMVGLSLTRTFAKGI